MKVTILGNSAALPTKDRNLSAQVLQVDGKTFLIDCGEGTQIQLIKYNFSLLKINAIFISHIHGDHYLGLVGLLSSMAMLGRTQLLYIYAPIFIQKVIDLHIHWQLTFSIEFIEIIDQKADKIFDDNNIEITAFPVNHSVPTHGFLFTQKNNKRKLLPQKLTEYEIPTYFYKRLCNGEDYTFASGEIIKNEWVTEEGKPNKSYAYCADTMYDEKIFQYIEKVNLLYHEATYKNEDIQKAQERMHSTTAQAATIALKAKCEKLLIGHFSAKYKNLDELLNEAKTIFINTEIALQGVTYIV